ncbi:hypothetical protein KU73_10185 [Pectobacterium wasabiae]|uniref:Concentrative nucleoside transporter C-terminal domain-containing protein n=1 Tax=Pectobacterium wasabiae TaxID=55208 RepID=A0AAW3EM97_9GAMM|nr:hypothetical protein JV38_06465 [Pectobacterium wasabiae]KGA29439.1 hypothetical protein KU73_10185 [Pectobacterium wasabiae]
MPSPSAIPLAEGDPLANFASIGIIAGAIKRLNEAQGNVVSRFGLKLVYGSTLVSLLSAAVAELVF